jgi:hypothetical protein
VAVSEKLGAKLGPRVAELVTQAVLSTKAQSMDHTARLVTYTSGEILRLVASQLPLAEHGVLNDMLRSPAAPADQRRLLEELTHTSPTQQVLRVLTALQGVWKAGGEMGEWGWRQAVQDFKAGYPYQEIDGPTAALLAAQTILSVGAGREEAARSGYNADRYADLLELSYRLPSAGELLEEYRRGLITPDRLRWWLARSGYHREAIGPLMSLWSTELSAEILATAVMKGWLDYDRGVELAHRAGTTPEQFKILWQVAGDPPGLMQLLEAYRRDIIDQSRLEHGIRQSRIRNEWIDVVTALRYMPPSPDVCIEGAVKGHLTPAESQAKAERAGLDPGEWEWLFETHGTPPGAMEMIDLWNRGEVGEERVVAALKQGHLANRFIPDVLKLRRRLPALGEVILLMEAGVWDKPRAIRYLRMLGYTPEDAADIAAAGSRAKIREDWRIAKDYASAQYELGLVSKAEAAATLETVGYEPDEAAVIIQVAELKRLVSQQSAAVDKIRSLYVGYKLDAVATRTALLSLRIPAEQVGDIMELWRLEREANVKQLTESQIVSAWKYNIIPAPEAIGKLMEIGYTQEDAWILLSIANKGPLEIK